MERRAIIDMASGIAGGALLILAIVLFAVVPSDDPVPPTFQVSYIESAQTVAIDDVYTYAEEETHLVPTTIESQYVHRISFAVEWTDDVGSSDPDTFTFIITSPDGERVTGQAVPVTNPPANISAQPPTTYTAQPMQTTIDVVIRPTPRDGPVPGEHLDEDEANAKSRLLEDTVTYPAGQWSLEVYLESIGDCPAPEADPERAINCAAETQNNGDTGNDLRVISVSYVTYDVQVKEIVRE